MSFLSQFFDISDRGLETKVSCPFDHFTASGIPYKESVPSAHINTDKNVFHCKSCNTGVNETQFIQRILGCNFIDARKIQRCFENDETIEEWKLDSQLILTEHSIELAKQFQITDEVLQLLDVKSPPIGEGLAFPVFMYGQLCDIRVYNPTNDPKVTSRTGSTTGLIIPFDIWRETDKDLITIVCAGEKDMSVARSFGFNAITITGGELAKPKALNEFKDRKVVICYDNDTAGIRGAKSLAIAMLEIAKEVKVCSNFHEICKEEGEDICDFFNKYEQPREALIHCIEHTDPFVPTEEDYKELYPEVDLITASQAKNVNKVLQSNIQVVAVSENTFITPTAIEFKKTSLAGKDDTLYLGQIKDWELKDYNVQDILHLIDNNFTDSQLKANKLAIAKLNPKERCVKQTVLAKATVFKAYITDLFETINTDSKPMEYTVYSLDKRLESGGKYKVTYKLVPHPYKGQQLIMIVIDAVQANDSVSNFQLTPQVKENLNQIRNLGGTVAERIDHITEKAKGLIGYDGNNTLIQAIDLSYHTPLEFNFGRFKNMRGYLDTIIVSESRLGKSSTADALRKTYGLGAITSLAGNSATIGGLIGGSNKAGGSFQTRAGLIPQNHKSIVIFEEFGKSNNSIISELTDIRSSNEVRISRVSGTITLPAMVRMIALTNVKSNNKGIRSIASYPNGISIITELVDTAEDIARYDLIVILSDKGKSEIDPLWEPAEPFTDEVYQHRIRWAWSRTADQIILSNDIAKYIMEQANELNKIYGCHIKIFGTEAWKKISRLATAVAAYLVSTDEEYETIIVKKEHVDYAVNFLTQLYDNNTFKLREYVEHERRYTVIDDDGVANLQDIYNRAPSLIMQLEQSSDSNKNTLSASTGLEPPDLNKMLNRLTKGLFIRFINNNIVPTERFRLGLARINKDSDVRRVGE